MIVRTVVAAARGTSIAVVVTAVGACRTMVATRIAIVVTIVVAARMCTAVTAIVTSGVTSRAMTAVTSHTAVVSGRTVTYIGRGSVVRAMCPNAAVPSVIAAGTSVVVVTAMVVIPEGEVPCVVTTDDGTIEVLRGTVEAPLPIEEDVAEVSVAIVPVVVEGVGTAHIHEVLKIDLIYQIVLLGSKVELVGHLVGEVVSVLLRFAEAHTECGEESRKGDEE